MAESMRSSDYKVTWDVKGQAPFSGGAIGFSSASVGDKAYFMPDGGCMMVTCSKAHFK